MTLPLHAQVMEQMARKKVSFVVIGVTAVNFYARDRGSMLSTIDCDLYLGPGSSNLRKALAVLGSLGYELTAGGEPLIGIDDFMLERLIERGAVIRGTHPDSLAIDLVLSTPDRTYADWRRHARAFKVGKTQVKVAALPEILEAKKAAGRNKDKAFLKLYSAQLKDLENKK